MNSFWIIIGIILGIIVLLNILKMRAFRSPEIFAKIVAKKQLKAYKTAQIKYPEASKVDLIIEAISSRPNVLYYHGKKGIIKNAREHRSYRFSVQVLILMEYEHLTGKFLTLDKIEPMYKQVQLIIPEDL